MNTNMCFFLYINFLLLSLTSGSKNSQPTEKESWFIRFWSSLFHCCSSRGKEKTNKNNEKKINKTKSILNLNDPSLLYYEPLNDAEKHFITDQESNTYHKNNNNPHNKRITQIIILKKKQPKKK